jgi:tape measure domain-containing protein
MMATAGIAIGTAAAAVSAAGVAWSLHFLTFKEDSIAAFKAMTGSQAAAERIFMNAAAFASKTPFKESQVIEIAQSLMTRGFKENELEKLMMGVGDIGAMLGTEKMQSVIGALGKMRASGQLTGETMQMLADAGINVKLVYAALAKQLGKTDAQVKAMISAGQIKDQAGINATMDAIAKGISGGKLGGAMEEKSRTLTGLLSTLEGVPENLMAHANMSGMLGPIKDFIKELTQTFIKDGKITDFGERVIHIFEAVGNTIGEIVKMASGDNLQNFLKGALNVLEPLIKAFLGFARGFGSGFLKAVTPIFESFAKMSEEPGKIDAMVNGFVQLGIVMGYIIGLSITAAIAFAGFVEWVVTGVGEILDAFGSLVDALNNLQLDEIGMDLVQGLINGILSMLSPAGGAMQTLGDVLISSLEDRLQINSPSRVTFDIGSNTGAGLLNGIDASGLNQAWGNLMMNPSQMVTSELTSSGGGNSQPQQFTFGDMHFHIDGATKDGNEIAQEASSSMTTRIIDTLRGHATESGR